MLLSVVGCHLTELPEEDCVDALDRAGGAVETAVAFERLAWDETLAESVRVGDPEHEDRPDVAVIADGLAVNRIIYRYVDARSCAIAEGCVGGTGWRRLLQFDASVKNLGGAALEIGDVDYYLEGADSALAEHNIFEYSDCHEHYHFSYYGDFRSEAAVSSRATSRRFACRAPIAIRTTNTRLSLIPTAPVTFRGFRPAGATTAGPASNVSGWT